MDQLWRSYMIFMSLLDHPSILLVVVVVIIIIIIIIIIIKNKRVENPPPETKQKKKTLPVDMKKSSRGCSMES